MQAKSFVGRVDWFDPRRGHGFISRDDGDDVFVHYSNVLVASGRKQLRAGDVVEFEIFDFNGRLQARGVRVVGRVTDMAWRQHG